MARTVELNENELVLRLSGINVIASLKKEVEIPYSSIKSCEVKDFETPMFAFRIGTSGLGSREGRFLIDGEWCFLSFHYENKNELIVLELENHEYKKVVFQVEEANKLAEQIQKRIVRD